MTCNNCVLNLDCKKVNKINEEMLHTVITGPPGTGKSSFVRSIAVKYGIPIYNVKLSAALDENQLTNMLIPPNNNNYDDYDEKTIGKYVFKNSVQSWIAPELRIYETDNLGNERNKYCPDLIDDWNNIVKLHGK